MIPSTVVFGIQSVGVDMEVHIWDKVAEGEFVQ
jgi:hypothetical protein